MAIVFPILGLVTNAVLSFGVKLAEKVGYRTVMFFGGLFISASFIINSLHTNFIGFIFIYCVFVGISSGLVYMLPICIQYPFLIP